MSKVAVNRELVEPMSVFRILLLGLVLALAGAWPQRPASANDAALWHALSDGRHFAMIRHTLAPGTGDPQGFTLGDCSTQRNLSEVGRAQARRIGDRFRAAGIWRARVYTSQWCRCRDTAAETNIGPFQELSLLNSFYENPALGGPQINGLRAWLARQPLNEPMVLVTHFVVISGLVGAAPTSGEIVVVRRDDYGNFQAVGSILAR